MLPATPGSLFIVICSRYLIRCQGRVFSPPPPPWPSTRHGNGGGGNLDYRPACENKVFEFERCILLLAKPRRCRSAPSHAISGGLEGGEGVANVDAPGYAGVLVYRDL